MVTVFNAMTFALKVTPFSVKSLSEASVAMDRFRVELPLLDPPLLQEYFPPSPRVAVLKRLEEFHFAEDDVDDVADQLALELIEPHNFSPA